MKKQQFHKLAKPIGEGSDEHGDYRIIPLSMVRGGKLKPFNVYTDPVKHIINDAAPAPRGWYKDKNPESDRVRPRPCYTEAILTTPYGGFCPVSCGHCYINNGTRGYRATGLPTVNPHYPDNMKKQLANCMVAGAAYITSFTEPFHPTLEDTYHVTQRLTQVFLDEGLPLFYLSRMRPPEWAVEALLENPYSYMQWSINTSNAEHFKKFSPGAPPLEAILKDIEWLSHNDIFVSIQCNPIMAGITTLDDLLELIHVLSQAGANHIIFKFVEQVANNRQVIVDRMRQRKLPNVDTFDGLFNQVIGGVYTIEEDVRIEWLDELLEETREVGMTMGLCYEYYDDGAAGANLAPYYTTADQCHGRGVPMYYRPEKGAPFEPLPGCYRKGCLYCADYGTQACDNDKLLQATALTYSDLRSIQLEANPRGWDYGGSCLTPDNAIPTNDRWFGNLEQMTDAELWVVG